MTCSSALRLRGVAGKRKGTREARLPTKVLWMRRMRVLRRLLSKCVPPPAETLACRLPGRPPGVAPRARLARCAAGYGYSLACPQVPRLQEDRQAHVPRDVPEGTPRASAPLRQRSYARRALCRLRATCSRTSAF